MKEITCDVLIVGGGVAGLAAALASSKNDLNTILIEKESEIGFKMKGECIRRESPIFNEIFGLSLPENVILNDITERRMYSPSTKKYVDIKPPVPFVSIEYRLFLIELFKKLSKTPCQIFLNTELVDILQENQTVVGALCLRNQEKLKIHAKYLIGADGVHSKFLKLLNAPSDREVYPTLKLDYENLQVPNPHRNEICFITNPPGGMWMFPKGKTSGECGIVVYTHDLPKNFDILELWEKKSQENEVFRNIIKNAKPFYILRDFLNFDGPLKQIFGKGFVVVGDSGGHVGGIGGAGIISSMSTAYDIAKFVSKALTMEGHITEGMIQEYLKIFKRNPIQKFLKNEKKIGKIVRDTLFQQFKTEEAIDENWSKFEGANFS